jgi:hypothetical protein
MNKTLVSVCGALLLVVAGPSQAGQVDITKLPGYEVVTSATFNFSSYGWAGWSARNGKVVLGAKIISVNSISQFNAFRPVGPGETTPFGYTYEADEYGFILQNGTGSSNNGVQFEIYYADRPQGYTITKSSNLSYSPTGWGGWSAPTGDVVSGGGFQFAANGARPASSQIALEGSAWPHYTFGSSEQGWVVQNGSISSSANVYVISFDANVTASASTGAGPSVENQFSQVGGLVTGAVEFDSVTQAGTTTVSVPLPGTYQTPSAFSLGDPPLYFDISTTAQFTGKITVCVSYDSASFPAGATPSLFHYEGGAWKDVTTSVNTVDKVICGEVTSLSPFAVGVSKPVVTASVNPEVVPVSSTLPIALAASVNDENTGNSAITKVSYTLDDIELVQSPVWNDMTIGTGSGTAKVDAGVTFTLGQTPAGSAPPRVVGVYELTVRGTDAIGSEGFGKTLLVVYDPNGGFVTGGGWIVSPAGAMPELPAASGKANFGFVSKYNKGASVPSGQTQFTFDTGALKFVSSSYDWLVVNQNASNAQYKGVGTIEGRTGTYGFMLWAFDGAKTLTPDTFRIKIWDMSDDSVVYDNKVGTTGEFGQPIGGGSIIVHAPTGKK